VIDRSLDLSPGRGEALVDTALERRHVARLHEEAAPLLSALSAGQRPLQEFLLGELARLAARLDALEQMQGSAARTREEMIRLDPLRFIPKARVEAALAEAPETERGPVAIDPADPDFAGSGWWHAETTEAGALRWSGQARCATLLLPALGGGDLKLTFAARAPFGVGLDLAEQSLFLDGVPLAMATLSNDGVTGVFEGVARLPELPAGARITLLLHGAQWEDPATGPRRDTRRLGLGLGWARLERVG
jgi:hypothetical protein